MGNKRLANRIPTNVEEFKSYLYDRFSGAIGDEEVLTAGYISNRIAQSRLARLMVWYELGELLKQHSTTVKELCRTYGVSRGDIRVGKMLVERYSTSEECRLAYLQEGCPTLNTFLDLPRKKGTGYFKGEPDVAMLHQIVNKYLGMNFETAKKEIKEKLAELTTKLIKYFPVKNIFDNVSYFQYSFCVGCGKECEKDALQLYRHPQFSFVILPYCEECVHSQSSYNPELVIKLYALYVLQLEEYLNRFS